jgi:DnaJ-class molecular chaperone
MEFKPGEVICNECNGTGLKTDRTTYYQKCSKCYGTGKLDWIENIVGKQNKYVTMSDNFEGDGIYATKSRRS